MATDQVLKPLNKFEKAAVLMLCMDEKSTADLFSHLQDDEIRQIGGAMLKLQKIPAVQIQAIMDEFVQGVTNKEGIKRKQYSLEDVKMDGKRVIERLISRSLPQKRSQAILHTIGQTILASSSEERDLKKFLKPFTEESLYDLLKEEHPQLVALALVNAKKSVARAVLDKFSEEVQVDICGRMARMDKVSEQIVDDLRTFMTQKLAKQQAAAGPGAKASGPAAYGTVTLEGLSDTLRLLKSLPRDRSMKIVEEIEKMDPEIGAQIVKQMFTIEDLERADDNGIRELLRGITTEDLKVALKNVATHIQDKFFRNMSERAAMILKEDMEVLPPLKVEEIEAAQQNILKVAKDLMKEEKLKLTEATEEDEG